MTEDQHADDRYVEFVQESFLDALRTGRRHVFTNRGLFHAGVVMREMVSNAKTSLDVVSGCLHSGAYDADLLRQACRRLNAPVRVVITDTVPLSGPTALRHLVPEIEKGMIDLRVMPREIVTPVRHFALSDGHHLRSEQDQREKSAIIVLNAHVPVEDGLSTTYQRLFENYWQLAESAAFSEVLRGS